jgi:hypothetical protein
MIHHVWKHMGDLVGDDTPDAFCPRPNLPPKTVEMLRVQYLVYLLIGIGVTKGYELVNARRIDTVLIGRRRYATLESLKRLATPVDRQEGDAFIADTTEPEERRQSKKRGTVALKATSKQRTELERRPLK